MAAGGLDLLGPRWVGRLCPVSGALDVLVCGLGWLGFVVCGSGWVELLVWGLGLVGFLFGSRVGWMFVRRPGSVGFVCLWSLVFWMLGVWPRVGWTFGLRSRVGWILGLGSKVGWVVGLGCRVGGIFCLGSRVGWIFGLGFGWVGFLVWGLGRIGFLVWGLGSIVGVVYRIWLPPCLDVSRIPRRGLAVQLATLDGMRLGSRSGVLQGLGPVRVWEPLGRLSPFFLGASLIHCRGRGLVAHLSHFPDPVSGFVACRIP